ncbi:threonine/serine exporter [Psychromonas sp. B3M02]|uniref:threonine/serine exporter family protein n=1 Tax=unclassified Psychromonas TaxID=2614957 RepID=UPI000DE92FE3|nr:threonine/serine exporter family protein [Psychromonas sp. B3M02]RBW47746.1 threonine/serine exporter [Psychromonas sp. B3M02]
MIELLYLLLQDAWFAWIPAVGFAMVFNVPSRMLIYCAIGGALTHSSRFLLMHYGVPIEWATFIVSANMGFLGLYWSRKHLIPRPVFTVASVIPMIPGSYAFTAMIALVEINTTGYSLALMQLVMENGLRTLFILTALSFGLALPSILIYRGRPIV